MSVERPPLPAVDFTHIGPPIGERFPDVTLPDQTGQLVDLHTHRAGRRALVVFHRSASWWPYCKTQLVELQRSLADYAAANIAVYAISYDSVGVLGNFAEQHGIKYPLFSDEGSKVIAELGLLNRHREQQSLHYGLTPNPAHEGIPYPGSFILDEAGVVRERHLEQSYRNRPTAADFLESSFSAASSRAKVHAVAETDELRTAAWLDTDTYFPYQKLLVHLGVQVRPDLHIFGEPIPDGYVPLSVEVAPVDGLELRELALPGPQPFRVAGLDEQFHIFEGELTGSLPLSINQNSGDIDLTLSLRYQACSATECFPPRTVELRLPLQARDNIRD